MNTIKPAAIALILALGAAGAVTVAPAAARLHAGATERVVMNQQVDAGLPTVTVVAKRMTLIEKIRTAG